MGLGFRLPPNPLNSFPPRPPTHKRLTSLMELTAVSASMLRAVFASDQDMYPAPLTLDRLQSWVTACPSLSVCFRTSHPTTSRDDKDKMDSTPPLGVVIVCPLRRVVWEDLLAGRLREPDIDAASMFPSDDTDGGVGLHVFHIERLVPPAVFAQASGAGRSGGFAECAMEAVRAAAGQRLGWHVIGYSGTHAPG